LENTEQEKTVKHNIMKLKSPLINISNIFLAILLVHGSLYADHNVHVLLNVEKIFVDSEQVLKNNSIIIRDGIITRVGKDIEIPADAMQWDLSNKTVSPGWIDMYVPVSALVNRNENHQSYDKDHQHDSYEKLKHKARKEWMEKIGSLPTVHPQTDPLSETGNFSEHISNRRDTGFTSILLTGDTGVFMGYGHLLNLGDTPSHKSVVLSEAVQCASLESGKIKQVYPSSLMGAMALIRQTFLDTDWYTQTHAYWNRNGSGPRPPHISALKILGAHKSAGKMFLLRADKKLDIYRLAALADEFSLNAFIVGTGKEYIRLAEASDITYPLVIPLSFQTIEEDKIDEEGYEISLSELRDWDRTPSNCYWLQEAGIDFAFSTRNMENIDEFRRMLDTAIQRGLSREKARKALTTIPARILGIEDRLGTIKKGMIANLIISSDDPLSPESEFEAIWIDGKRYETQKEHKNDKGKNKDNQNKKKEHFKQNYSREKGSKATRQDIPPGDFRGPILSPDRILIRNGTIWTSGPAGKLENHDILVESGRIISIGVNIESGPETHLIDAAGKHITPGIIDEHSHAYTVGPVNEGTYSSTAEVRIMDIIDSESSNIYLHLASGVTTSNLFHGSANSIGGQTAVVKLKWGMSPDNLVYEKAPIGIKFALGENVKQSNWGDNFKKRFPQTRMGVEQFIRERFLSAKDYLKHIGEENQGNDHGKSFRPLRRNLELEALGAVIQGEMPIHCHAYRADEILMLIRLAEEFNIKIATFEHCLEGYKVADELAAHGAGASIFSDWWAYKFEVYDAIPYNGALMWNRGVLVAFNSDSAELARRLNLEAAKGVKYGGIPEEEALKCITINPAIMLGIEKHVGSIESGKDADFAIWSHNPLSTSAVCEQTWIEGKKYFDRNFDKLKQKKLVDEHSGLLKLLRKTIKEKSSEKNNNQNEKGTENNP